MWQTDDVELDLALQRSNQPRMGPSRGSKSKQDPVSRSALLCSALAPDAELPFIIDNAAEMSTRIGAGETS